MKIIKIFSFIATFTLVSACSSAPPQVEASRSMIEKIKPSNNTKVVPQELWADLSEGDNNHQILYKNVIIILGRPYVSALGLQCRNVSLQKKDLSNVRLQQRIVCQMGDANEWLLMSDVVDNKDEKISIGYK